MDVANIFSEDNGINRIKTFLIGASDGATYGINDFYLEKINNPCILFMGEPVKKDLLDKAQYMYDFCNIEAELYDAIGWKHDYRIGDPALESVAKETEDRILNLIKDINENPERFFECVHNPDTSKKTYYWVCNSDDGYFENSLVDHHQSFDTQEDCYADMMQSAVEKIKYFIQFNDVTDDVCGVYNEGGFIKMREEEVSNGEKFENGVHCSLRCMPHKIVTDSYGGVYTYEIMTKTVDK